LRVVRHGFIHSYRHDSQVLANVKRFRIFQESQVIV